MEKIEREGEREGGSEMSVEVIDVYGYSVSFLKWLFISDFILFYWMFLFYCNLFFYYLKNSCFIIIMSFYFFICIDVFDYGLF